MKGNISGYNFSLGNRKNITKDIFNEIDSRHKNITISCLDSDFFNDYYGNPRYGQLYNKYDYLINSSKVMRLLSVLKFRSVKYISSTKLMIDILSEINNRKYSVYIYSKDEKIDNIKSYIKKQYPNIKIVGIANELQTDEEVISSINKVKPDTILVANTDNIQSEFILDNVKYFDTKLVISCGAIFNNIINNNNKNNEWKFFRKFVKYNIDKKKKRYFKPKGFVVGWFYPPQTTAQAISTYKILKNSKLRYDVFTTRSRIWNYASESNFDIFATPNIKVFMSDESNPDAWCELAKERFLKDKNKYDFFMTRVMPSWSHDVGLKIREAGNNTKWIASFADPMFNSPYVLYNTAINNFDEKTANKIVSNYEDIFKNPDKKEYECFKPLIEEKEKILKVFEQCDLMIFTNKYQLKWMLGDLYNKYKDKCLVLSHSYDPDFYLYHEKRNSDVTKFLFMGHTDQFRNLNNFVKAVSYIIKDNPKFSKKIKVTLIGNIYDETINLIKQNKLEKIFVIEKNVDYMSSLDLMSKSDVLLHSDAKFNFMEGLNVYFASKISDYLGSEKLIFSLSTEIGPTVDVLKETNHIVCEVDDIDKIKKELIDIVDGKYNNLKHNNYIYSSVNVVKEYDEKVIQLLKRKK